MLCIQFSALPFLHIVASELCYDKMVINTLTDPVQLCVEEESWYSTLLDVSGILCYPLCLLVSVRTVFLQTLIILIGCIKLMTFLRVISFGVYLTAGIFQATYVHISSLRLLGRKQNHVY